MALVQTMEHPMYSCCIVVLTVGVFRELQDAEGFLLLFQMCIKHHKNAYLHIKKISAYMYMYKAQQTETNKICVSGDASEL